MRLVSWNVNGLRAAVRKGFEDVITDLDPFIFSIQETKMQEDQKSFSFAGYHEVWNDAERKGYSGTLCYVKEKPLNITLGINDEDYIDEGRIITLEYEDFYFINTYSPNAKPELKRLDYRMTYEDKVRDYYTKLKKEKPVILTGDLNVAHKEIDIKNPKSNERNAGFTIEERNKFSKLLDSGFIDTFRYKHPNTIKYSYWSYRFNARKRNVGWRLDYFLVSDDLKDNIQKADILTDIYGSDHCPVILELDL